MKISNFFYFLYGIHFSCKFETFYLNFIESTSSQRHLFQFLVSSHMFVFGEKTTTKNPEVTNSE